MDDTTKRGGEGGQGKSITLSMNSEPLLVIRTKEFKRNRLQSQSLALDMRKISDGEKGKREQIEKREGKPWLDQRAHIERSRNETKKKKKNKTKPPPNKRKPRKKKQNTPNTNQPKKKPPKKKTDGEQYEKSHTRDKEQGTQDLYRRWGEIHQFQWE